MSRGLDGVRRAFMPHADLAAIGQDALVLAVFAGALAPFALQGSQRALRPARPTGSVSHY